jgi:hypothetical protein
MKPTAPVLLAVLLVLAACATPEPTAASASDHLPAFGWPPSRMRPPSAERPVWLPSLPADLQRVPVPDDGFHDHLG